MSPTVNEVLAGRDRIARKRRLGSAIFSILLHAGLVTAFVLAPALVARPPQPFEYQTVQIVPLKALGVPEPRPTPPAPDPEPAPPEEPETLAAEPEEERPRLPSPTAEPPRERPRPRETAPTSRDSRDAAPRDSGLPGQRQGAVDGNPLGLSPFGTTEPGFDDPDFQYSYYTDQMVAILGSNWIRPPISAEVQLLIHFVIGRDGRISDIEIRQPSGYDSFDLAGLSAVESSSPLPPLPASYPNDTLGVNLIIE